MVDMPRMHEYMWTTRMKRVASERSVVVKLLRLMYVTRRWRTRELRTSLRSLIRRKVRMIRSVLMPLCPSPSASGLTTGKMSKTDGATLHTSMMNH